jgi:hypothetical protein
MPMVAPVADLIGLFPTRTQVMAPLPPVCRSRMSSLGVPDVNTSASSARYL